jgi:hypothetical protein
MLGTCSHILATWTQRYRTYRHAARSLIGHQTNECKFIIIIFFNFFNILLLLLLLLGDNREYIECARACTEYNPLAVFMITAAANRSKVYATFKTRLPKCTMSTNQTFSTQYHGSDTFFFKALAQVNLVKHMCLLCCCELTTSFREVFLGRKKKPR